MEQASEQEGRLTANCNNLNILMKKHHLNKHYVFIKWIFNCMKSAHKQQTGNCNEKYILYQRGKKI